MEFLKKVRELIDGRKTHITAVLAWVTAVLAWAAGDLSDAQVIAATYACLAAIFLRKGVAKALKALKKADGPS